MPVVLPSGEVPYNPSEHAAGARWAGMWPETGHGSEESGTKVEWQSLWDQVWNELQDVGRELLGLFRVLIEALIIFLVARLVARWIQERITGPRLRERVDPNLENLLMNGVTVLVYAVAVALLLGRVGVNWSALVTYVSVVTVAITLSAQQILMNIIAGVYILLERPFLVGEQVNVRAVTGAVERIELRTTSIRSMTGELVLVPNSIIFSEVVTNRSATRTIRTDFTVSGLTGETETVLATIREAVLGITGVRQPEPVVEVTNASASGLTVQLRVWHNPTISIRQPVTDRLRQLFPECEVTSALEPTS